MLDLSPVPAQCKFPKRWFRSESDEQQTPRPFNPDPNRGRKRLTKLLGSSEGHYNPTIRQKLTLFGSDRIYTVSVNVRSVAISQAQAHDNEILP